MEHRLFCRITQNWRGRPLTVELPTTTKRFVERHIFKHGDFLGNGILVLKCVFLALRIEDVQKIGHAALVTFHGEIDEAAARRQRAPQGFLLSEASRRPKSSNGQYAPGPADQIGPRIGTACLNWAALLPTRVPP
jgi:hypothetical protein